MEYVRYITKFFSPMATDAKGIIILLAFIFALRS